MRLASRSIGRLGSLGLLLASLALPLTACGGGGSDGTPGAPGASTGVLSGTVTNSLTGLPMAGATIALTPSVVANPVTDASGNYSVVLPVGSYSGTCSGGPGYVAKTVPMSILAAITTDCDFALAPTSPVVVTITGAPTSPAPGASFDLTGNVQILDGSTITGFSWSQDHGAAATIASPLTPVTNVTLGTATAYKAALVSASEDLERWRVMPVNPLSLEEGADVALRVSVTTTSGSYKATATVAAKLPFATWASGIQNVPLRLPVLFSGKTQASYAWSLTLKPAGSTASLNDATTRFPWFVPDVAGQYRVSVTDLAVPTAPITIDVWSGPWVGMIAGIDGSGNPTIDPNCLMCHTGGGPGSGPIAQFDAWKTTGHAQVFRDQMNTSTHYSSDCFPCHTVGYEPTVSNGGIDDASDYGSFLSAFFPGGHMTPRATNYANVVADDPATAKLSNIQCESCHGPNGAGSAHVLLGLKPDPRVSLAADVCGVCHGEPPRHGRFQQWKDSGHGNYEVAMAEGQSTSCARCHSAQGFMVWLPRLQAGNNGALLTSDITWNASTVHPITCAVCHDPHKVGTTTTDTTDAPMRVQGDTPALPSGYTATAVGKGAMCITCHNTRNGQRDDLNYAGNIDDRAPHVAAQGDVLMGYNAYFMPRGDRGAHSFIEDTCVECHMDLTPPPEEYSFAGGGTNHQFTPSMEICIKCHGEFNGGTIKEAFEDEMGKLRLLIGSKLKGIVTSLVAANTLEVDTVTVNPDGTETTTTLTFTAAQLGSDWSADLTAEFHGRMTFDLRVGATVYPNVQMAKAHVQGAPTNDVLHFNSTGQYLARSSWNYHLFHGDGSNGIHNPAFAFDAINAAYVQLNSH